MIEFQALEPAVDVPAPCFLVSFVHDTILNAGHHRLPTKRGERGVLCVRLKEVHMVKNSLPSCQYVVFKNSWAGLLPAFSHVKVDSFFVPLSCPNSSFTATLCWRLCASAIVEAKLAS